MWSGGLERLTLNIFSHWNNIHGTLLLLIWKDCFDGWVCKRFQMANFVSLWTQLVVVTLSTQAKSQRGFFAQISPCNTKQTFQGGFSHIQLKYFEYIVSKVACLHKQTLLASTAENTTSQSNSNFTIPF